ncbi:hypothetical protein CN198_14360 [Sinorhizobium meliloti]|uniref:hypothetical protein n=1 Tax=Rhizobium meliloti TaxID=382 RepID=UPI000FD9E6EB|nr:hypothetical protein [Sinorhizobium meliloti]RVH69238.1 hypothetical protein CN198_14360 [Sinorhizobium meliloti]
MNNTALTALATEAVAKLTAIHADLADIAALSASIYEATSTEYRNHEAGRDRPFCVVGGDYWLARQIAQAVKDIRDKIIDSRWESCGAIHEIASKVEDREKAYSRAEEEAAREARIAVIHAEAKSRDANAQNAEAAERIVSDFLKISSHTEVRGKGKRKEFFATVVFLFNGNVYEVESKFDRATNEFSGYDFRNGRQGYVVRDRREMQGGFLFKPEMTDEEIGKAAHALDCIRAALREQVGPLASEAPAVPEEAEVLEEAAV